VSMRECREAEREAYQRKMNRRADVKARVMREAEEQKTRNAWREVGTAWTEFLKEHPIIFSAPMVRAILDGRKTQTRRTSDRWTKVKPGDRLWVRETWALTEQAGMHPSDAYTVYRATDPDWETMEGWKWRPSIHIPRAASRITLEVVSIRQERLWQMSREDAWAEGIGHMNGHTGSEPTLDAVRRFAKLWDEIYGKVPYKRWDSNPFLWRIEFKVLK
jgi:hypothetical protein